MKILAFGLEKLVVFGQILDRFERYRKIKYHGLFLFLSVQLDVSIFIKNYWKDLNALTSDFLDIHYSDEDMMTKNGFEIIRDLRTLKLQPENIILPGFLLWEVNGGLKSSEIIPLNGLSESEIFIVIQFVVQSIQNGLNLNEIKDYVLSWSSSSALAPLPDQLNRFNLNLHTSLKPQHIEDIFKVNYFSRITSSSKTPKPLYQQLSDLVAKNEIEKVIEKVIDHYRKINDKERLKTITSLSARFFELKKQERFNLISNDKLLVERARICKSLLELIEEMSDETRI